MPLPVTHSAGQYVGMSTSDGARGWLRQRTAEEIRVLLARKRMSAAELARRTGIKQSTMARRMTGETAFDLDDLELIAQVLDVEVTDLLPRAVGSGLKETSGPLTLSRDRHTARPKPDRPITPGRRDATRPVSAIPATKRRPVTMRPPARPTAA